MGCALPRLALHWGHDDGQRLGGRLGVGFGAQRAAGRRVGVVGVVHRHTADHVRPLTRTRAAGQNKRGVKDYFRWFIFQFQSSQSGNELTRQQGTSCRPRPLSRCGWWWCWRQDWECQRWWWAETGHPQKQKCCGPQWWSNGLKTRAWRGQSSLSLPDQILNLLGRSSSTFSHYISWITVN